MGRSVWKAKRANASKKRGGGDDEEEVIGEEVAYSLKSLQGTWCDTLGSLYEVVVGKDDAVEVQTTRKTGQTISTRGLVRWDTKTDWIVWGRSGPRSQYWLSKLYREALLWERPGSASFAWFRKSHPDSTESGRSAEDQDAEEDSVASETELVSVKSADDADGPEQMPGRQGPGQERRRGAEEVGKGPSTDDRESQHSAAWPGGAKRGVPVEVRKNPWSSTWYSAVLHDARGEAACVSFDGGDWPSREVPAYAVRLRPAPGAGGDPPDVDEEVEVFFPACNTLPSCWALGTVRDVKGDLYSIDLFRSLNGAREATVDRGALRRRSDEVSLRPEDLARRRLSVDEELHDWIRSPDSLGCLSHVHKSAGLLMSDCTDAGTDAAAAPEVLLVGDDRSVDLGARLLQEVHFPNQLHMRRFSEQREHFARRLRRAHRKGPNVAAPPSGEPPHEGGEAQDAPPPERSPQASWAERLAASAPQGAGATGGGARRQGRGAR